MTYFGCQIHYSFAAWITWCFVADEDLKPDTWPRVPNHKKQFVTVYSKMRSRTFRLHVVYDRCTNRTSKATSNTTQSHNKWLSFIILMMQTQQKDLRLFIQWPPCSWLLVVYAESFFFFVERNGSQHHLLQRVSLLVQRSVNVLYDGTSPSAYPFQPLPIVRYGSIE